MSEGTTEVRIFAIGDLHLPGKQEKPMDIFGSGWTDHPERIRQAWLEVVGPNDWVLMPGDLSWAMTLEEAADDLAYLGGLPGTTVIIRGNHDYWWSAIGKVRRALPPRVYALQNDHVLLPDGTAVCGTRGWDLPSRTDDPHDAKVFQREVQRLRLSLESAVNAEARPRIVMMHYPPMVGSSQSTPFTDLMEEYGVSLCVYGHLHGAGRRVAVEGVHRGVEYRLVACDAIGFRPLYLCSVNVASPSEMPTK